MSEDNELSKIYNGLRDDTLYWTRLVAPRIMEVLCRMDDIVTTGDNESNTTFTMEQVHRESHLGSVSAKTIAWVAREFLKVSEPLVDIDDRDNTTLTDEGRDWRRVNAGA
jgi:hypothetical protein